MTHIHAQYKKRATISKELKSVVVTWPGASSAEALNAGTCSLTNTLGCDQSIRRRRQTTALVQQ